VREGDERERERSQGKREGGRGGGRERGILLKKRRNYKS